MFRRKPLCNIRFLLSDLTTPVIPHVGRSITYIEGSEDESISCFSYSFPYPTFAWSLSRSDGSSVSTFYQRHT